MGDGEIPRTRVRRALMGEISIIIPEFSTHRHGRPIMKISSKERNRTKQWLQYFEKNNGKHVDLNDERFALNNSVLLSNLKLPKRRKISSKIKRTANRKAISSRIKAEEGNSLEALNSDDEKKEPIIKITPIPIAVLEPPQQEPLNSLNLSYEENLSDLEPLISLEDIDEFLDINPFDLLELL